MIHSVEVLVRKLKGAYFVRCSCGWQDEASDALSAERLALEHAESIRSAPGSQTREREADAWQNGAESG